MEKQVSKPIKIDSRLFEILEIWLKSNEARSRGYHSKSVFVTEAVRDLLEQNMGKKPQYSELVSTLNSQKELIVILKDTAHSMNEHMEHVKKLERFWFKANFPNIEKS